MKTFLHCRALKFCGPGGPPHVKLVIEWDPSSKEHLFGSIHEEVVKDAESVKLQQQQHLQQHSCTLDECFQLYTKEEQLAPDDAWKCPHCKQLQQGMVKMSLWTLPDILILHLKRFRQVGERRNKLSTLIRFPLTALNMAPHVAKRSQSLKNLHAGSSTSSSRKHLSSQNHQPSDLLLPQDYLYDLYAVCNHHGGMHGGHYTGSISSSASDHWLIRLTGDSKRGSLVSPSSTNISSSVQDSPQSPVVRENGFEEERGGFENRPFVRGLQGRSVSMRVPTKPKESLSKKLPMRWSLGSKDRRKPDQDSPKIQEPDPAELVQYLESGRRPRCTKDSIVTVMNESRSSKKAPAGRAPSVRSSNGGSMSCVGKMEQEPQYSQVPEGQKRQSERTSEKTSGKTASLRRKNESVAKEETSGNMSSNSGSNTLSRRKDARRHSSSKSSQEKEAKFSSSTGVPPSYSTSSLQDGTLKRQKGDKAKRDHQDTEADKSKTTKDEVPKSHDGLLSFLKGNFLKKDKDSKKSKDGESGKGSREEEGRRTLPRASLPNGAAGGRIAVEGSKSNGSGRRVEELANGKIGRSSADIRRSQSSSNIPTKAEQSIRRTASLHRNGMPTNPASSRSVPADKPSFSTLQRTRYSTTSLGRKKTVPESSF
ncbi:PREDICTED: ubiquitin carboxyl-terminal hydrolase 43-like [Cyprinodon variegatus]|uniref:ubiquitin carboxyl-terminal hydrolase 43-like n=1 Tax=Cyprinodon variegatus TaxID=28743 RepID=UPI0007428F7E|nr:PREDICTED: ubiquitin carboxyl-terminal hydrolase 43-like [Cyprinodon variegatus]